VKSGATTLRIKASGQIRHQERRVAASSPARYAEDRGIPIMKNIVVALATGLTIVSLGIPGPAAAQRPAANMTAQTRAISRSTTGEVLRVNRGAQALTVRTVNNGKEIDAIFEVQDSAARVLDALEPGDLVRVRYVRINDQLRAERIERVEGSRG